MTAATATATDVAERTRPASAQINARIDPELKARGDAALAAAGYTPTQAIRALWELAARHADDPAVVVAALEPERAAAEGSSRDDARARDLALIEEGATLMERTARSLGLSWPPATVDWSVDDLKEEYLFERHGHVAVEEAV